MHSQDQSKTGFHPNVVLQKLTRSDTLSPQMNHASLLSGITFIVMSVSSCTPTDLSPETPTEPVTSERPAPILITPPLPAPDINDLAQTEFIPEHRQNSDYALPPNLTELPNSSQLRDNQSAPKPANNGSSTAIPPISF